MIGKIRIKIPHGSKKSLHQAVIVVELDEEGNELPDTICYAVMCPDGSVLSKRYESLEAAQKAASTLDGSRPT